MNKDELIERIKELEKQQLEIKDYLQKLNDEIQKQHANFNAVNGAIQESQNWLKKMDDAEKANEAKEAA